MTASASSPSGATEWEVSYVLPELRDCKNYENSSSIVFDAQYDVKTDRYSIKGFTITVTAENEADMFEMANRQAERLAQIMTLKSIGYVNYAYHGYIPKNPQASGEKTVRAGVTSRNHTRQMIDELYLNSNQAVSSVMQNDEDTNIQLYHARLAIEAEENRQYANMYRELFQVIEKETRLPDYYKYKSLCDAISHQRRLNRAIADVENYFGKGRYEFTANQEFNHKSSKNRANLKDDAKDLKKIVISHLIGKLR
jgi:hypothetical protein